MRRVEKIVEIILSEILSPERVEITEKKIMSILLQQGYKVEEINEALHLIFAKLKNHQHQIPHSKDKPIRVFTPIERYKMSLEAQRLLLQLYYSNAITLLQLEEILSHIESTNEIIVDKDVLINIINDIMGLNNSRLNKSSIIN